MQNFTPLSKTQHGMQHFSASIFSLSALERLSDKELYRKCQLYGAEARKWTRKFAALLPEVERRQLYRKHGFYSIFEFAAKLAGMKHDTVLEILRVAKKLEDKPLLLNKLEEQGVNKLRLVANIATKENQKILAEKVDEMSKATLATFIQEKFRAGTELEQNNIIIGGAQTGFSGFIENNEPTHTKIPQKISVTIPFEPNVELQLREFQKKLSRERKAPVGLNEVIKTLLEIAAGKLEKSARNVKSAPKIPIIARPARAGRLPADRQRSGLPCATPKQHGSTELTSCHLEPAEGCPSRHIPIKTKKLLRQKFAGRCAWPGCIKLPDIYHHTLRFALNSSHNLNYIVPLCKNHERLAHHGLIENEEKPPENWQLRSEPDKNALKYQIDQKVIAHYAPKAF